MLKLEKIAFVILLLFPLNYSFAQVNFCDNCYIWEFTSSEGERNQTTRLLSNDVEDILSQYAECKVLQRSRYAKLQEQIDNEKAIQSLNTAPTLIKAELKIIKAKRVIFGSVNRDFQGNVSLRLSFENLETSQVKSNTVFLINEDYYNFDKRKQKLAEFVGSFIDPEGKIGTPPMGSPNKPGFSPQTIEDGPWRFTLEGCKRSGSNLVLSLKAVSEDQERVLRIIGQTRIPGTKIIDDKGREFKPSRLSIANKIGNGGQAVTQELVADLPTEVLITFGNLPEDAKKVMVFQLSIDDGNRVFKFRNIEIEN